MSHSLRVTSITHETLVNQKDEDETFDDALQRILGVTPQSTDELTSFYPEKLRTAVSQSIETIANQEEFERIIVKYDDHHAMKFKSPITEYTIVRAEFKEDPIEGMTVYYRDNQGEFQHLFNLGATEDYQEYEDPLTNEDAPRPRIFVEGMEMDKDWAAVADNLERRISEKIRGSYRRWGT